MGIHREGAAAEACGPRAMPQPLHAACFLPWLAKDPAAALKLPAQLLAVMVGEALPVSVASHQHADNQQDQSISAGGKGT